MGAAGGGGAAAEGSEAEEMLIGDPEQVIQQVKDYLLRKKIPRQQLRAVIVGIEKAGFARQLLRDILQPKNYNGKLKALGCWVLGDKPHLTLDSDVLKFAVEYTHSEEASYVKQQQAGIPCVRAVVTDKPQSRCGDAAASRAAAEERLLEKLDLHALGLLMWRLQNAEGLPLGILQGMLDAADGVMQGTASQQRARSSLRVAIERFAVGSRVRQG
jgi:hypothetical protein